MSKYILDIETNGHLFEFDKVWCIVLKDIDTREVYKFGPDRLYDALSLIQKAKLLVGHNIIGFDIPALNKYFDLEISVFNTHVFDTLIASRLLQPDRLNGHSLAAWGKTLGFQKLEFDEFSEYSQEMLEYCIQDVELTKIIFDHLKEDIRGQYKAFKLEQEFAQIITYQIDNGFTLDIKKAEQLYNILEEEYDVLYDEVRSLMPLVRDNTHYTKVQKEGLLLGEDSKGYTYETAKTKKVTYKEFKYLTPNPTSRPQIVEYFKMKGWVPKEFTEKNSPKISETILNGMLYPEAKKFSRLFRLQKQMGMIKNDKGGWLHYCDNEGRVRGSVITCGANTRRCTHSKPNLAQVDKKDIRMREVWVAREGWILVGCDASGLELRILGHYLAPYDKGAFAFLASQPKEKVDLHTENQKIMGLNKRDSAKTAIYALIYGAGNGKLGFIQAQDRGSTVANPSDGAELRANVEQGFAGYKQLIDDVKAAVNSKGYLKAIDGGKLNPRNDYSSLNLLIQSAGAIVMKQALINFYEAMENSLGYTYGTDYALVVNVHDEFQVECDPSIAETVGKTAVEAIRKTSKDFSLDVELDGEYLIGNNWGDTH